MSTTIQKIFVDAEKLLNRYITVFNELEALLGSDTILPLPDDVKKEMVWGLCDQLDKVCPGNDFADYFISLDDYFRPFEKMALDLEKRYAGEV